MTPADLRAIGEHLYGHQWQCALARELAVTPRTVRYWLRGERAISPATERAIGMLLKLRPPAA